MDAETVVNVISILLLWVTSFTLMAFLYVFLGKKEYPEVTQKLSATALILGVCITVIFINIGKGLV